LRFFQKLKAFPHEIAQEMVAVDYHERLGLIATAGTADAERIIGAAHWILDVNQNMAEVAFSVADDFQRRGIGTYLSHLLVRLAKEAGIRGFRADVLTENIGMRRIFEREALENGSTLHTTYDDGEISLWFHFGERRVPSADRSPEP
jgi:GNAT superfamily N-acetyltransferase